MIQEIREQSQQSSLIEGERLLVLQQLQRSLNPFQEGRGGARLRAFGLKSLYARMVDPSPDFLETTASELSGMPYDHLWDLRAATYQAGENPGRYFDKHEVAADHPEKLKDGIGNFGLLLGRIMDSYDTETEQIRLSENLNPRVIAETVHERIQIDKGTSGLRRTIKKIQYETDLRKRYRLGLNLKRQVLDHIGTHSFEFYRRYDKEKPMDPTWENLTGHSLYFTEFIGKDGSNTSGWFGVEEATETAQAAITRYHLEKRLAKLPSKDSDRFEELRLQYGAKAANLIILSGLVEDINQLRRDRYFGTELAVPDFQVIPVDSYRAWREGKLLDSDLQPCFEWASGLKKENRWSHDVQSADYIVRSSAVFSEDGENITGAGVYASVKVYGGGTFQDFKDAVTNVYESTDSPRALAYRAQHGITEEEMGLVIQKYITPDSSFMHGKSFEGYVNSRLAGIPQFMEVVTGTSRNFVKRKELDSFLALPADNDKEFLRNIHHFPPDQFQVRPELPIQVSQLTSIVERVWGRAVQIEFVVDGLEVNFVQVRELPASVLSQVPEVQFPDEPPIHCGASIGIGDMELPVLDNEDNSEKTGVTVIPANHMFTMRNNDDRLPKEGAVIISDAEGKNGHIQTLCAEKGLICIFPDINGREDSLTLRYHELLRLEKVRIVSNGIEGRVYGIE